MRGSFPIPFLREEGVSGPSLPSPAGRLGTFGALFEAPRAALRRVKVNT